MNADEKLGVRFIRVCLYPRSSVFIGGLILFFHDAGTHRSRLIYPFI
ncbi:MAG TPA: hypothetical protein VNY05_43610 [Candidatus Acidoferrales bacterium]|jgi:hypothetical protein|nr:hypothetical protein [Candidatus Acidoferrales bacterium]